MSGPNKGVAPPKMLFCGDVCLAEASAESWAARPGESVFDALTAMDGGVPPVVVANVEGTFTARICPVAAKYAIFRADPDVAKALRGLDVALLANNHVGDFGQEGAEDTIRVLRQRGAVCVGYGRLGEEGTCSAVIRRGDVAVGIVNLCCPSTNPAQWATWETPGAAPLCMEILETEIRRLRPMVDCLVFCPHWGAEMRKQPVPEQIWAARQAIRWGADAVIGNHAHVVQCRESYLGKPIYYGLGNLLYPDGGWVSSLGGTVSKGHYRITEAARNSIGVRLEWDESEGRIRDAAFAIRVGEDDVPRPVSAPGEARVPARILAAARGRAEWLRRTAGANAEIRYWTKWSQGRMRYGYESMRPRISWRSAARSALQRMVSGMFGRRGGCDGR